jgi:hypothetical protein
MKKFVSNYKILIGLFALEQFGSQRYGALGRAGSPFLSWPQSDCPPNTSISVPLEATKKPTWPGHRCTHSGQLSPDKKMERRRAVRWMIPCRIVLILGLLWSERSFALPARLVGEIQVRSIDEEPPAATSPRSTPEPSKSTSEPPKTDADPARSTCNAR